jgi:hypothetical protein
MYTVSNPPLLRIKPGTPGSVARNSGPLDQRSIATQNAGQNQTNQISEKDNDLLKFYSCGN